MTLSCVSVLPLIYFIPESDQRDLLLSIIFIFIVHTRIENVFFLSSITPLDIIFKFYPLLFECVMSSMGAII
jgi:hypothetical protein